MDKKVTLKVTRAEEPNFQKMVELVESTAVIFTLEQTAEK